MHWLVLPTLEAAQARANDLSVAMGYPHPSTGTERASLPMEHPTNEEGAVPIGPAVWSWVEGGLVDMASLLTDVERSALYDRAEMAAAGWYRDGTPPLGG
jgi:hypothetical protein